MALSAVDIEKIDRALAETTSASFIRLETGQTIVISTGDIAEAITGPVATMALHLEAQGTLQRARDDLDFLTFVPFDKPLIKL